MNTRHSSHLVVERRLYRVEIVRANGDERSAATDVEVQLVLKIQEATSQFLSANAPIVHVVIHVDVTENSTHDIRTNHLRPKFRAPSLYLRFLTHKHLDALLLGLDCAVHLQITPV